MSKSKAKGTAHENDIRDRLLAAGIEARRQEGSGMFLTLPGDVVARLAGAEYLLQVKYRQDASGFKIIYGWMNKPNTDVLVLKADLRKKEYDEPLYIMKESVFFGLVKDAGEKDV